ncbi:hypothetical protein CCICO_03655 [Corynebacterium ciconiae DSM 44920]|nr:hypothetical protein CCICO_03655 [Corynebacterium ciconiae DSM 44920]
MRWAHARWVGLVAAVLIIVGSYGGGAIRNRGGVLEALGLDFMSYGHGAGVSNTIVWLGIMGIVAAWILLGRQVMWNPRLDDSRKAADIRTCLITWVAPLLLAAPILSRDVYSYLMQGAMLRDGFDPYTQGAAVNPGPFLLEVSHDWRNTTTPYGPLHLWIGEGITSVVGDNVTLGVLLYKVVSIIGFIAIAWSTPKIAHNLGGSPALALWLGVANPVMVLHLVGGMHNESLMVGLVSVGLLCALRRRFVSAVALISIAVSLKATAALALPFLVWMGSRHLAALLERRTSLAATLRSVAAFVITGAWMVVEFAIVMVAITAASGSNWGWVSQISGNSKVINPLALPSLIADLITPVILFITDDFSYNTALAITRPICGVIMLIGIAAAWWFYRQDDRRNLIGITVAYGCAVVFNAVTLPWYYTSLLNVIGTFRPSMKVIKATTLLSIIIGLAFTGSGNHQLYNPVWMVPATIAAYFATGYIFSEAEREQPQRQTAGTGA